MKKLRSTDYPDLIWNFGTVKVKRCLRKMRIYAKVDFKISENKIEEIVKEAMSVCTDIESDEVIWESLNLIIL